MCSGHGILPCLGKGANAVTLNTRSLNMAVGFRVRVRVRVKVGVGARVRVRVRHSGHEVRKHGVCLAARIVCPNAL